jgi:hypothetical protein
LAPKLRKHLLKTRPFGAASGPKDESLDLCEILWRQPEGLPEQYRAQVKDFVWIKPFAGKGFGPEAASHPFQYSMFTRSIGGSEWK